MAKKVENQRRKVSSLDMNKKKQDLTEKTKQLEEIKALLGLCFSTLMFGLKVMNEFFSLHDSSFASVDYNELLIVQMFWLTFSYFKAKL